MKHAYLIVAHDNFDNLRTLLKLLDNKRNNIYLHIDKKNSDWNLNDWENILNKASLHFVKRVDVYWGTYSQIEALKCLMAEAIKTYHDYYHVLSGVDLPIKNQETIDDFFLKNNKKEFVGFANTFDHKQVHYKNYFLKYFKHKNTSLALWAKRFRNLLIQIQKKMHVDTLKKYKHEIKKGCDWYSITHEALEFLLSKEPEFKKYFYKAMSPGEFFVQTILYNSHFRENIYCLTDENIGSQRYIDWERGIPYIFRNEDIELLMNSKLMFARKFNEIIDRQVIDNIYTKLTNHQED